MPRRRPNHTGASIYADQRMKGLALDPKSEEAQKSRAALEAEFEALPEDKKQAMEEVAKKHNDKLARERQMRKERRLRKLQKDAEDMAAMAVAEGRPAPPPLTFMAAGDEIRCTSAARSRSSKSRSTVQAVKRAKMNEKDERGEIEVNGTPCVHHDGILFRIFPRKQPRF